MKLSVNRQAVEADAGETLAGLLQRMSVPAEGVAVAVNNRVVPRSEWATTPLHEEDRITIIRAARGGGDKSPSGRPFELRIRKVYPESHDYCRL